MAEQLKLTGVAGKIARVMSEVGYIPKDKRMEGGGMRYDYLSEEALTAELHSACAEHGLVITPVDYAIVETRVDVSAQKSNQYLARVRGVFRFSDGEDGTSFLDVCTLGEGRDAGDKCLNKAMTGAFKYALRQAFLISTGEDPDHTASEPIPARATDPRATTPIVLPKPRPAAPSAPQQATGDVPKYRDFMDLLGRLQGMTEEKPGSDGGTFAVPSKDGKEFIKSLQSPDLAPWSWKMTEWSPEQAITLFAALKSQVLGMTGEAPSADMEDPFGPAPEE